jgi:hypothetical protein
MVEIRENNQNQEDTNVTPETITTSMILEDLENGVDRTGIKSKYSLETWEVKQMFDHPTLKGKKAKRIKKLSFNFVDDVNEDVLPGQIDLEDAIKDEIEGRKIMDAQDQKAEIEIDENTTDEYVEVESENVEEMESRADDWSNENNY